jgi:hypothetical protein
LTPFPSAASFDLSFSDILTWASSFAGLPFLALSDDGTSALSPAPRTTCDRAIAVYLSFSLDDLELFANLVELHAGVLQLTEQVEPPLVIELLQFSVGLVLVRRKSYGRVPQSGRADLRAVR